MRGQADLISTVILVGVAVAVALGIVYYLLPYLGQSSRSYQVSSLLASYSSSLEVSNLYNSSGISVVYVNKGGNIYRLYAAILGYDNNSVPRVVCGDLDYMNESYASPLADEGWAPLPSLNVSPTAIRVYIKTSYYRLSDYYGGNTTLYDLGLGGQIVVRANYTDCVPGYGLYLVFFARVSDTFFEIAAIPLR